MKEILNRLISNGALLLLIIAVLYILFLRECKKPLPCPAEDEVIVKKDTWKEMIALADKPPITHIDTIYIKGETIIVDNPLPPPVFSGDTTIYSDSLIRSDINVSYNFKVKGVLLNRKWAYNPIVTEVFRTDSIFVPQLIEVPVKVPKRGLFVYGTAGGNNSAFLFGGGLDFVTKKNTEIGYMFQRFGDVNFHSVKIGVKLGK